MSDPAKVNALYKEYGPVIFARCRRILGDAALAEDATQETFIRVLRHLEKAPSVDQALGWIYRIATNLCLNEIRNQKRRAIPVEEIPEKPTTDIGALMENRDVARRLMARMKTKEAEVAWLYYVDGFDQVQVATTLGVSRRTVINRLQAFQAHAKKYLARNT